MTIYAEEARRFEVKDRTQETDIEDEETVLDFLVQYEVYKYLKKHWWIYYKNFNLGKCIQVKN